MKILHVGDIFGDVGKQMLKKHLPHLEKEHSLDLVIVNVENCTRWRGLSLLDYEEIQAFGTGVPKIMTSGNHIFDQEDTVKFIGRTRDLLKPLNMENTPGRGTTVVEIKGWKIRVTNILGTTFMGKVVRSPYRALEELIEKDVREQENKKEKRVIHLVDFHAEASAEKKALALWFSGQIDYVGGTHTHTVTADEEVWFPNSENAIAFQTDVGMTGPRDGVIGASPEGVWKSGRDNLPLSISCEKRGRRQLCGSVIEISEKTGKPISIKRVFISEGEPHRCSVPFPYPSP